MMLAMALFGSKVMLVKLAAPEPGAKSAKKLSVSSRLVSSMMETEAITLSVPVMEYSVDIAL